MNCLKCGEKLPEGARFCKGCGTIAGSKFQKVNSPLYRSETVLRQGPCKRIKNGGKLQQGTAMLTNHRLVFFKTGFSRTFQMIFMRNMVTGDIYIPLTEIRVGVGRGGGGRSSGGLTPYHNMEWGQTPTVVISTKAGETYSFVFENHMDWKNAIQRAVMAVKQK